MDLQGIANSVASAVNPNIIVTVQPSTGSTIGAAGRQLPAYGSPVTGTAQVQALDNADLKLMDGLNLQGVYRAIYLRGVLAGVIRANGTGGDLVTIGSQVWKVAKVLETWPTWTKAAIVLQTS